MNQNERAAQRSALVAWVESKLNDGYNDQKITISKTLLQQLPNDLDNVGKDATYEYLTKFTGLTDAGNAFFLADSLHRHMNEFLVLDRIESSGYYNHARLPLSLLEEHDLKDYIEAAEASAESAHSHLEFLKEQQAMDSRSVDPNSYVCIIASSGTGKTQLAATASLTYKDATTIYLNMGGGSTQRFYGPHIESVGSGILMTAIRDFIDEYWGEVRTTPRVTANAIKNWAEGVDDGTSLYVRLLYHLLTGEVFQREGINAKVKLSELKRALSGMNPLLVFLDEVPVKEKQNFEAVLCLRDTLRYLGIAPILMSTHTGAQEYVGAMSRQSISTWTWIMSALPKYAPLSREEKVFLKDTERPLILRLVKRERENSGDWGAIVKVIQEEMQKRKTEAWTKSPDLQLVQLFETDVDLNSEWFASAHNLVGHHYGWLTQGGEDGRKSYSCTEAVLFGMNIAVAPVCAAAEPLLYLALVAWNEEMLREDGNIMFPLVDGHKSPLTVRGAFNLCKDSFKCSVSIENQKAEKNDGNLLEVLVHASLTLASMKTGLTDESLHLGGMTLKEFIPLVRTFMLVDHFKQLPRPPSFFDEIDFAWPTVPALGSSNSGLPSEISKLLPNSSFGFLQRPEDKAMADGRVYNVRRGDNAEQPFLSFECMNFRDGVSSKVLKEVFKRIKGGIKCSLVFVSYVQSNAFVRTVLTSLKEECFKEHKKDCVSVVVWDSAQNKDPFYLQVGGEHGTKPESFQAKEKVSLLVVVIAVGCIKANVNRKRKLTYPPCANH